MYRRPKFLEVLHEIREEMSRQADYDVDLFVEMIRSEQAFDIEVKLVTEENLKRKSTSGQRKKL
jgi:hypothetical protein